jgi:hypothetical protein
VAISIARAFKINLDQVVDQLAPPAHADSSNITQLLDASPKRVVIGTYEHYRGI